MTLGADIAAGILGEARRSGKPATSSSFTPSTAGSAISEVA
jgi:hypothetical protein